VAAAFPELELTPARLGPSGFKFVLRGIRTKDKREVVLKIPLAPLPDGLEVDELEEFAELMDARFRHEIEGMKRVKSPHVATILAGPATREIAGHHYVWYLEPYYPSTLAMRLGTLWPAAATVELLRGLLRGAESLAQHGIVHRDIKPHNIAFDANDLPVLLDLGAGLFAGLTTITGENELAPHTPGFCAPEQVYIRRHRPDLDYRTDMFCIGIVGFLAHTGRHPFRFPPQGTPDDYRRRLRDGDVDTSGLDAVNTPQELRGFLRRLLGATQNARFRTFEMAFSALEHLS